MAGESATPELPEANFQILVSTFATQGMVSLGQIPNPATNKKSVDLAQAKFAIDLLQVLQEKSEGNLSDEEKSFLDQCLYQMRMLYIDRSAKT